MEPVSPSFENGNRTAPPPKEGKIMLEIYTTMAIPICLASLTPTVLWLLWIVLPIYFSAFRQNNNN